MRYESLVTDDGILMGFDVWSHAFYPDFIKGYKEKRDEYENVRKPKYKTKEVVGQSIDVKHIGTSLQRTFNFPRTRMEVFGYYFGSLFQNIDWIKIATRWRTQCSLENKKKGKLEEDQEKKKKVAEKNKQHEEL